MIAIKADIPIPPARTGRMPVYPWREMKIGDSFVALRPRQTVSAAASWYGKTHGMRFEVRAILEEGQRVVRVWRVE